MDDTVTQADRERAADLIAWHNTAASEWHIEGGSDLRFFAADMPDGIRKGIWDNHEVVQAFARHRIAHQPDSALADELRALAAKATPGPWEMDTEYDPDALASGGGGCTTGFNDYSMAAEINGKWKRIFDSINSEEKLIEDDRYDLEGSAWDEVARANFALIMALRNNLDRILTALGGHHEPSGEAW